MNFTHSRHNSIVTTALPIPAVVCVGEWVVWCVGVCGVVSGAVVCGVVWVVWRCGVWRCGMGVLSG